jgi:hypothetical protein
LMSSSTRPRLMWITLISDIPPQVGSMQALGTSCLMDGTKQTKLL